MGLVGCVPHQTYQTYQTYQAYQTYQTYLIYGAGLSSVPGPTAASAA